MPASLDQNCREWRVVLTILITSLAGCTFGPEFGAIDGRVVIPGQSGEAIRVEFHPDAAAGTTGPSSVGETDAEGNFRLNCATASGVQAGAVVGKHRVVLQDLRLAQSETGRGIPLRITREHSAVLTTPIVVEVKSGPQTILLDLSNKKLSLP